MSSSSFDYEAAITAFASDEHVPRSGIFATRSASARSKLLSWLASGP